MSDDDFYLFLRTFARLTSLSIIHPGCLALNQKIPGFCRGYRQASTIGYVSVFFQNKISENFIDFLNIIIPSVC